MGLYDEQIKKRKLTDEEMFTSSFVDATNSILGKSFTFSHEYSNTAVGQILKYFKSREIDLGRDFDDIFRSEDIIYREVNLTPGWRKDATGCYIGVLKETNEQVAIIPQKYGIYYYFDSETQKYIKITKKNENIFASEALCFYRSLPNKSLNAKDLLIYSFQNLPNTDKVLCILAVFVSTMLGLIVPKLNYFMFNYVALERDYTLLISTFIFGICVIVSAWIFSIIYRAITATIGIKVRINIESAVMMRLLSLSPTFFKNYSAGDLSRRIAYLQYFCQQFSTTVIFNGITSIFYLTYLSQIFIYAKDLAWPAVIITTISLGISILLSLKQLKISRKKMELDAKNTGLAYDTILGIQKIKLAGSEKRMFARFANSFSNFARATYNPPFGVKTSVAISLAITLSGQFITYYIAIQKQISVASYYAFQTSFAYISTALATITALVTITSDLFNYLQMSKPILESLPERGSNLKEVKRVSGSIEINNISFKYDNSIEDVISNLSLKIKSGEYVAIVGKSGCGKSTLAKLLLGFEKPHRGAIYYDGNDLESLDKNSLRIRIGTVMQDDQLFLGSVYQNISICKPGLSMEDAWESARLAGIDHDIEEMPMGMQTIVAEGNSGFSGGQKQRLMIARAIAPKPKILIFDEATSALDNITQKQIINSLDSLQCTRIVIAHRLSTVIHCDRILVLDKGKIVEEGTYDELIKKNGNFAELVERQRLDN